MLLAPMAGSATSLFARFASSRAPTWRLPRWFRRRACRMRTRRPGTCSRWRKGEPSGVQLFGHEPAVMASQAAWIEDEMGSSLAYLDVNMGCPARKIVSKGDGSALMKDPDLASSIVEAVRGAVSCPVTVKFRRGWAMGRKALLSSLVAWKLPGGLRGRGSRTLRRAALPRQRRLGCDPARQGRRRHPRRRQRRCPLGRRRGGLARKNGLRRDHDRPRLRGKPPGSSRRRKLRCQARRSLLVPAPSSASRWRGGTPRLLTQREGRNIMRMRKHAMWYMAGLRGCKRSGKDQLLLDPRAVRRRFRRAARDDRRERERGRRRLQPDALTG